MYSCRRKPLPDEKERIIDSHSDTMGLRHMTPNERRLPRTEPSICVRSEARKRGERSRPMAYAPRDERWPSLQRVGSQIPQTTPRNRPRQKPACGARGVRPARRLSHLPCNTWTSATGVRTRPRGHGPASRHSSTWNGKPSEDFLPSLCCFSIQNFPPRKPIS